MELRPARIEDAAAISALIRSFAPEFTVNPDGSGAEEFFEGVSETAESQYIADPRYNYIVAYSGETLAGLVAVRDGNHLFHLFVSREFQRCGLAKRLWQTAKETAVEQGNRQGFTVFATPRAVPVYERFGFVQTGPRVDAKGISIVPMRLSPADTVNDKT